MVRQLVQGDTKPDLEFTVTDKDDNPIDLSTTTVNFYFREKGQTTVINTGHTSCTVTDGPNGKCKYVWGANDLANSGEFEGELELTYVDTSKQTVTALYQFFVRGQIA